VARRWRARDANRLLAALERVSEPVLAVVYADADGAAGMQVAGWIRAARCRRAGSASGARWYDWQGPVRFAQLRANASAAGAG
jgi:acyl-homoserine lactone acylase PvdQ